LADCKYLLLFSGFLQIRTVVDVDPNCYEREGKEGGRGRTRENEGERGRARKNEGERGRTRESEGERGKRRGRRREKEGEERRVGEGGRREEGREKGRGEGRGTVTFVLVLFQLLVHLGIHGLPQVSQVRLGDPPAGRELFGEHAREYFGERGRTSFSWKPG
jgi:hypothetical protein